MRTCIFHSVNSALYFWDGKKGLLVDGIHQGREQGLSPMPEFLSCQLEKHTGIFAHTDGILFTHLHGDHFWADGLKTMVQRDNRPFVYSKDLSQSNIAFRPLSARVGQYCDGNLTISAVDTVHDGEKYKEDVHQSFLLAFDNETFFVAGDALLGAKDAALVNNLYSGEIDCAFFNVFQLASEDGRAFIRSLQPKRILLTHLPFAEDDCYGYRRLAKQIVKRFPADLPNVEILPQMAWLDQRAADFSTIKKEETLHDLYRITNNRRVF